MRQMTLSLMHALSMRREAAHPPRPVICDGLLDLSHRVHNEGPLAYDWFVDRLAAQKEEPCLFQRLSDEALPFALKHRQLCALRYLARPKLHRAAEYEESGRPAGADFELDGRAARQAHVPHIHRAVGMGRALDSLEAAGDDAHQPRARRQLDPRDLGIADGLIPGRGFLMFRPEIDPELDHLEDTAAFGEVRPVQLLVHDAGGCRHPLHIARPDDTAAAAGIAMLDLAAIDDRHRLEAAMRMRPDPAAVLRGRKGDGTRIIQVEKWRELGAFVIGKSIADRESVADPVLPRSRFDRSRAFSSPCLPPAAVTQPRRPCRYGSRIRGHPAKRPRRREVSGPPRPDAAARRAPRAHHEGAREGAAPELGPQALRQ